MLDFQSGGQLNMEKLYFLMNKNFGSTRLTHRAK